jgi:cytochrome c peroxidase
MSRLLPVLLATVAVGALALPPAAARLGHGSRWSAAERATLKSLSLSSLEPLAADPSNRYGDHPRAAELGRALFFDTRLSGNGKVSCASCHVSEKDFQDGVALASGVGRTTRRTMPIAGTAHSAWMFWDGRADSQWGQALGPLESAAEHGGSRTQYVHTIAEHYRGDYEEVFGALPDVNSAPRHAGPVADPTWRAAWEQLPAVRRDEISRVYANIGKAIAAYERRIGLSSSRFDRYVDAELAGAPHTAESTLSTDEEAGLALFIGKGSCVNCHNGALLTDDHFHNTGVPASPLVSAVDSGRAVGVRQALEGEFRCNGPFSDAKPDDCEELRFAVASGPELVRAYKTPSLRNVARRAPYMHAGQIATLEEVLAHYSAASASPLGHSELKPLRLSDHERRQLVAFLRTLDSPLSAPAGWLAPPASHR